MKKFSRIFLFAAFGLLAGAARAAEEIVVVINAENAAAVDVPLLRDLYWGRKRFWPKSGFPVELVLRDPKSPLTTLFLKSYLNTTPERFDRFWKSRVLSGLGSNPEVHRELDSLIQYCIQNNGAIGFVSLREADRVVSPRIRKIRLRV